MTVANQEAMQEQLKALADSHKKAKLQELFSKQDELRQDELRKSKSSQETDKAEIEAMKSQFNDLTKKQLTRQISKQFDLRTLSEDVENPQAQTQEAQEAPAQEAQAQAQSQEAQSQSLLQAQASNLYGYNSDGSGDQKIDTEDVEAMKAEFDKCQKKLLQTQIEKSFNLRLPTKPKEDEKKKVSIDDLVDYSVSNDEDEDEDENKEESKRTEQEEKERIRIIRRDSIKLNEQYNAMNKMMLSLRSTKMLERIEPQIPPEHKERFEILMQDIGIINESIIDKLWRNIEDVVGHENVTIMIMMNTKMTMNL